MSPGFSDGWRFLNPAKDFIVERHELPLASPRLQHTHALGVVQMRSMANCVPPFAAELPERMKDALHADALVLGHILIDMPLELPGIVAAAVSDAVKAREQLARAPQLRKYLQNPLSVRMRHISAECACALVRAASAHAMASCFGITCLQTQTPSFLNSFFTFI